MYLYHKTLKHTDTIMYAISGSFSGPKKSEIILVKNNTLDLISVNDNSSKINVLISKQLFSHIKKVSAFRFAGQKRDHIVVTSDSGKLVILQADVKNHTFNIINEISYSKTGSRRVSPGEYLACDSKGRALIIGALEKEKYGFSFSVDNSNQIICSSPIEASNPNTFYFDLVSIENGTNNPLFCSLETEIDMDNEENTIYSGKINKKISLYELDLGINQISKKFSFETDASANKIIPLLVNKEDKLIVGILICCEGFLIFKDLSFCMKGDYKFNVTSSINSKVIILPVRKESKFKKCIITGYVNFRVAGDNEVIHIIQTDLGDLFKLRLDLDSGELVSLTLEYFDTIPPCNSICIMRNGILFAATDCSNR